PQPEGFRHLESLRVRQGGDIAHSAKGVKANHPRHRPGMGKPKPRPRTLADPPRPPYPYLRPLVTASGVTAMKKYGVIGLGLAAVLVWSRPLTSSPLKGQYRREDERRVRLHPGQTAVLAEDFKGGERACVIVEGDHKPVMELIVTVLDADDKEVAR